MLIAFVNGMIMWMIDETRSIIIPGYQTINATIAIQRMEFNFVSFKSFAEINEKSQVIQLHSIEIIAIFN